MKLNKENICVLIENEEQLQQAREILERCGENQGDEESMEMDSLNKYLTFHSDVDTSHWYVGQGVFLHKNLTPIPLSKLESVIKYSQL